MKLKNNFIIREIAGQNVIVATGEAAMRFNGLLTISSTASFLLKNFEKAESFEGLVNMLIAEYDVDKETAITDVLGFTKAMLDQGFIEMTDPEKKW